jgi:hypothetical protein
MVTLNHSSEQSASSRSVAAGRRRLDMPWYDRPSWVDLNRQLDQNQAIHFGELFEVEPRLGRPNKRSVPDPARPAG